jgi:hypothetical protein
VRVAKRTRVVASAAFAVMCAIFLLGPSVAAAGTLDQQQTEFDDNFLVRDDQSLAQTFTAGLSGGLDEVDLALFKSAATPPTVPLRVEIRTTSTNGVPGSTILASKGVPPSAVTGTSAPAFVPIRFESPAPVSAGTQYAIVAWAVTSGTGFYGWADKNAAVYPDGTLYTDDGPPDFNWSQYPNPADLAFRTYVAPPASAAIAPPTLAAPTVPTGQRDAALKKCKKKHGAKREKCKKKANALPV